MAYRGILRVAENPWRMYLNPSLRALSASMNCLVGVLAVLTLSSSLSSSTRYYSLSLYSLFFFLEEEHINFTGKNWRFAIYKSVLEKYPR